MVCRQTVHATVMNTKYFKGKGLAKGMDCRRVVVEEQATVLGRACVWGVELSRMKGDDATGYYECEQRIELTM